MATIIKEELFEIAENEFRVMLVEKAEWESHKKQIIYVESDLMDAFSPKQLRKLAKRLTEIADRFEKEASGKEGSNG